MHRAHRRSSSARCASAAPGDSFLDLATGYPDTTRRPGRGGIHTRHDVRPDPQPGPSQGRPAGRWRAGQGLGPSSRTTSLLRTTRVTDPPQGSKPDGRRFASVVTPGKRSLPPARAYARFGSPEHITFSRTRIPATTQPRAKQANQSCDSQERSNCAKNLTRTHFREASPSWDEDGVSTTVSAPHRQDSNRRRPAHPRRANPSFADPEGNYLKIAWSEGSNPVAAAARRALGQPAGRRRRPRPRGYHGHRTTHRHRAH